MTLFLAGCQIPNIKLPELPDLAPIGGSELKISATKGSDLNLLVSVPARICAPKIYLIGVNNGYINHWNQSTKERAFLTKLMFKNTPNSTTRYNRDLYKSAPIYSTSGIRNSSTKYGSLANKKVCEFDSFIAGKTKGQQLAQDNYQKLRGREQ